MVPVAFNEFQFSIDKKTHTKLYWGSNPSHKSLYVCARGPTTPLSHHHLARAWRNEGTGTKIPSNARKNSMLEP
jgi:hypothetical protein